MDPNETLKQINHHLFRTGGNYSECLELIEALAEWLAKDGFKPDEYLNGCNWEDVITGAYWFASHYYAGQASDEYRLLCVTGKIFSPGRCLYRPEEDSSELTVYDALVALSPWADEPMGHDGDDYDDCDDDDLEGDE